MTTRSTTRFATSRYRTGIHALGSALLFALAVNHRVVATYTLMDHQGATLGHALVNAIVVFSGLWLGSLGLGAWPVPHRGRWRALAAVWVTLSMGATVLWGIPSLNALIDAHKGLQVEADVVLYMMGVISGVAWRILLGREWAWFGLLLSPSSLLMGMAGTLCAASWKETWPAAIWRPDVMLFAVLLGATHVTYRRRFQDEAAPGALCERRAFGSTARFLMGLVLLYVVMGPVAYLAETRSFTAYVLQMLTMTTILPWLLVFSLPGGIFEALFRIAWIRTLASVLVRPVIALVVYTGLVTATLIPAVLQALLTYNWLHIFASVIEFVAAVCFWWPLSSSVPRFPSLSRGRQLFYLAYASNFMMPIIVYLFLSTTPWYPIYTRYDAVSALADQQMGSVVMLGVMYAVYGGLAIRIYSAQDESIWYA